MVEFLNTESVSERLGHIIRNAKKDLVIISPYLRANARIKNDIEQKSEDGSVKVHIIYRHREQKPDVEEWLHSMPHVKISFCEQLHAKCYFNEKEVLLTSMNLYEYSQYSNYEMGVLVSRNENPGLYKKIVAESKRIESASTTVRKAAPVPEASSKGFSLSSAISGFLGSKTEVRQRLEDVAVDAGLLVRQPESTSFNTSPKTESSQATHHLKPELPELGICIRCGESIALNPTKPYCNRCFRSWNRYKNSAYEEQLCHICGKEDSPSKDKPACYDCYNRYKNVLEFSTDNLPW